jgi:hypothetical protein
VQVTFSQKTRSNGHLCIHNRHGQLLNCIRSLGRQVRLKGVGMSMLFFRKVCNTSTNVADRAIESNPKFFNARMKTLEVDNCKEFAKRLAVDQTLTKPNLLIHISASGAIVIRISMRYYANIFPRSGARKRSPMSAVTIIKKDCQIDAP